MGFFSSLKSKILLTDKKEAFIAFGGELIQELIQKRISISVALNTDGWNVNPLRVFSYPELCKAANGFVQYFYYQGHSKYYAGIIDECDGGRPVTIQKTMSTDWDVIQRRIQEIAVHTCLRHGNVVQLLGYCVEPPDYLLVFECLCHLPGTTKNPRAGEILWHDRLRISIQVAEAISYIHSHGFKPIIQRDVKLSNVWLDENCNAKLSGFGLSVAMPLDRTEIEEDKIIGTPGYLDPAYKRTATFTERNDVYSFGMLLFWVITGREKLGEWLVETKVKEFYLDSERYIKLWIDCSVLMTDEEAHQKLALGDVIVDCTRLVRDERPLMIEVTKLLYAIRDMEPQQ